TVASVIGNSAWVAWMGDLVPDRLRGRFFGRRTVFLSIAGTLTSLGAAILLDRLAPIGWTGAALSVLTAAAFLAGVVSIVLMLRQHEPPVPAEPGSPCAIGACGPSSATSSPGTRRSASRPASSPTTC